MDIKNIIELYQSGKSLTFIANKYNTYGAKIKKLLNENGIQIRTHAEQNKIINQERGKKVDHKYFDQIDSLQKAWILGFLAADGSVAEKNNRIKIGLSSIDEEILQKIRTELKIEREVVVNETNQGFSIATLTWSSENQKKKLAQFSIVPNKTYKGIQLPNFEIQYQLAYLLGYFDGDGCFKNDGNYCRMEICSHDKHILEDFCKLIKDYFGFEKQVYKSLSRKEFYTITYSTKQADIILQKLYNLMDSKKTFYLARKRKKYNEWLQQNNRI